MARFAGREIESWNPSQDVRALETGKLYVLDGQNYFFDAKGPKSGFGSRIMHGRQLGNNTDIQAVDVGNQTIVFSSLGMWRQQYKYTAFRDVLEPTTFWENLATFNEERTAKFHSGRWTGAYLNGDSFVGHPVHGIWKIGFDNAKIHNADGVPAEPISVSICAGRLIVLTKDIVAWSGPGDGDDFVPELGGAGFIVLNQYLGEIPVGVTTFQQGFIIWGIRSAMVMEYIGGQAVFRPDTLQTRLYPIGPMSITSDANGRSFMMTRHGIAVVQAGQIDDQAFLAFNEFIRSYLNSNGDSKFRLDYILEDDMLYVQVADSNDYYTETFAFRPSLGKWGKFNIPHLGFCRFGAPTGTSGYADRFGRPHKITDTPDREVNGQGLRGLDSWIIVGYLNDPGMILEADTILEMQELVVSARRSFPANESLEIDDFGGPGYWYPVFGDDGHTGGHSKSEDWNLAIAVPETPEEDEDWNLPDVGEDDVIDDDDNDEGEDEVFDDDEDDLDEAEILAEIDFNNPGIEEDLNIGPAEVYAKANEFDANVVSDRTAGEDLNFTFTSEMKSAPIIWEDWNLNSYRDEDYMGPYSFVDFVKYRLRVLSSENGLDDGLNIIPELAIEDFNRDFWTLISSGRFQAVKISALEPGEKYHLTSIDATLVYQGQRG